MTWRSAGVLAMGVLLGGCHAAPRNMTAIRAYYDYDFETARDELRADAEVVDEQYLLNNARLGLAALADGANAEAERSLGRVFDLLSTAGLNEDRTAAAVLTWEGVRIWKGEPFEQALLYSHIATLYATLGEWDNVRAAATNALFRLRDFGEAQTDEDLARRAARDDDYLDTGYTAVDTNFALGFILQGIGTQLSGLGGADAQFHAAAQIAPELRSMIDTLRSGEYDTLLIVDYGKGPTKLAHGPDLAFASFEPQEDARGRLTVRTTGGGYAPRTFDAACDVDDLAIDHRWNNLEDVRYAKSVLGDALIFGGLVVADSGGHRRDEGQVLVGAGMVLAGMLSKAGARADTRYLEFAPATTYIAPLRLDQPTSLDVSVDADGQSRIVLPDVQPGGLVAGGGKPRAIYLRLHGTDSPAPAWLTDRAAASVSNPAVQPYSVGWKRRYGRAIADRGDTSDRFDRPPAQLPSGQPSRYPEYDRAREDIWDTTNSNSPPSTEIGDNQ